MHTATQANLTEGGQPKSDSSPKNPFMYKKEPKEPISCSGQLEPTWRGAVAGGVLIYTHIGGYGFESRCARAFFVVGFWCFGAQVAARAKRRVVRGRNGGSCEFGGWPRVANFPIFFDACFAVYEQRCALFYYTVRAPRGWDRILLIFSKDFGSSTMRFFLFE